MIPCRLIGRIKNATEDLRRASQGLILTSAKDPNYFHSAYRNLPSLRKLSPDPVVLLHPDTAEKLGIQEGDWVFIETGLGKIRQKVVFDRDLHPRVVVAAYGWWFPERKDLELVRLEGVQYQYSDGKQSPLMIRRSVRRICGRFPAGFLKNKNDSPQRAQRSERRYSSKRRGQS